MLPRRILYYGRDEALPARVALRAGPLSLFWEDGDLRYIRLGERELVRRIYVAVRDRNWDTVPGLLTGLQMQVGEDAFRITYQVDHRAGEIDFGWQGSITGEADGSISLQLQGVARTTFLKNRIGFCVLHPASAAGTRCQVHHVDGTIEAATLPTYIVPDQPVPPFANMQRLEQEVAPGLWADIGFSGDLFEMEDQRNWTDASFKTFSTPLSLPYPVEIVAGSVVSQALSVRARDERPATAHGRISAEPEELAVIVDRHSRTVPLPPWGLGLAAHGEPLSERAVARLRALRPAHLRVELTPSEMDVEEGLARAGAAASAIGTPLHVAIRLSEDTGQELRALEHALELSQAPVATWLVYPTGEKFWGGSRTAEVVTAAAPVLRRYAPGAWLASGTDSDLIFMQRTLPPLEVVDALAFSITPQMHAFDDASLVETLATQATAVATARRLGRGLPVLVSLVTLKLRYNALATAPAIEAPGELPAPVDPRQMSLFGAAWTTGSLRYLAEGGATGITYYETSGWRGVMERDGGSPMPERFASLPGGVFPLYHVLADAADFAGGSVLPAQSTDPLRVEVLAMRLGGRLRVIVANMTAEQQAVTVRGLGEQVRMRTLDETNAEAAMLDPESYRADAGAPHAAPGGVLAATLAPHAVLRLDTDI